MVNWALDSDRRLNKSSCQLSYLNLFVRLYRHWPNPSISHFTLSANMTLRSFARSSNTADDDGDGTTQHIECSMNHRFLSSIVFARTHLIWEGFFGILYFNVWSHDINAPSAQSIMCKTIINLTYRSSAWTMIVDVFTYACLESSTAKTSRELMKKSEYGSTNFCVAGKAAERVSERENSA